MARHEDEDIVVVEKNGSVVGPFLLGLVVGGALALLFAPMSGRALRGELVERGRKLRDQAGERAEEFEEMVTDGYRRARGRVEEKVDDARRAVKDVAEASRAAAGTARDELERRLSEAREARRGGSRHSGEEEPVA